MRTHIGTRDMRRRAFLEMLLTKDEIAKRGTKDLAAAITLSRFEILRNSSHGVVLTRANEVNSRLHDFIASVERGRVQTP